MPLRAFITGTEGKFIATAKVGDKEYTGTGKTEWMANQDLKRKTAEDTE